jgi:hypothetical protein
MFDLALVANFLCLVLGFPFEIWLLIRNEARLGARFLQGGVAPLISTEGFYHTSYLDDRLNIAVGHSSKFGALFLRY